jgi:hypothetical protein
MAICRMGAELFHAKEHRGSQDEANSSFSQYCEKRLKIALCGGRVRPSVSPPIDGIMSATKPFAGFS